MSLHLVYTTLSSPDDAAALARQLLEQRLLACANIVPAVRSLYHWQGAIQDESEVLLLMKTDSQRLAPLKAQILALHPYECPCLVSADLDCLNPAFAAWLHTELADSKPDG